MRAGNDSARLRRGAYPVLMNARTGHSAGLPIIGP